MIDTKIHPVFKNFNGSIYESKDLKKKRNNLNFSFSIQKQKSSLRKRNGSLFYIGNSQTWIKYLYRQASKRAKKKI